MVIIMELIIISMIIMVIIIIIIIIPFNSVYYERIRAPPWSNCNVLNHRSLPPEFEFRRGNI